MGQLSIYIHIYMCHEWIDTRDGKDETVNDNNEAFQAEKIRLDDDAIKD